MLGNNNYFNLIKNDSIFNAMKIYKRDVTRFPQKGVKYYRINFQEVVLHMNIKFPIINY